MPDNIELIHGDSFDILPTMDQCPELILTDPPYNITSNAWDCAIDSESFWKLTSMANTVIITASQPFSSRMVVSNEDHFKHEWIWIKNRGSNFANTMREPFKEHESILVFCNGRRWKYNKIMQTRTGAGVDRVKYDFNFRSKSENYRDFEGREGQQLPPMRVPSSWQKFNTETGGHPTQKPVGLMEYMIRTYTDEGDLVIDPFMGSGSTAIAAFLCKRRFIGIEKEEKYVEIAKERLKYYENVDITEGGPNG